MTHRIWVAAAALLLLSPKVSAQKAAWHDPSPHTVQFVNVDENVKLEVLDWGGSGRPLVLLAGLGDTAHVFDDFAPKLNSQYHVYGITRRGFGASSSPDSGYSADRLGDDVLAVLNTLKLDKPVLVGHSIAGQELSSVGSRHPERVAGLVYLDAAYGYAYFDRSKGDFVIDLQELRKKLEELESAKDLSDHKPLIQELLEARLPEFMSDLERLEKEIGQRQPPDPEPTEVDRASFEAWRSWEDRVFGFLMPEAELRQTLQTTPEGHVGAEIPNKAHEVFLGRQKYTDIRAPVLAIFAVPHGLGPYANNDPVVLAAFDADNTALVEPWVKTFEAGVPSAHVVRLPHADHYIFMSNEAEVLREMHAFTAGLN